jgi:hypothetical protein
MLTFWGSTKYVVDSFFLIRDNAREYHRLFAWGHGFKYVTHFPPTVHDQRGADLRTKKWVRAGQLEKQGIFLYHYSLLFPYQVFNKVSYYKARERNSIDAWEDVVYRRLEKPFRAHNLYTHIGWLERFRGEHPAAVKAMMSDIESGKLDVSTRDCRDVEKLLNNRRYVLKCRLLAFCARLLGSGPIVPLYRIGRALGRRAAALASSAGKG